MIMKVYNLRLNTPIITRILLSAGNPGNLSSPQELCKEFDSTGARPKFGKLEVDEAALALVRFFADKKEGWSEFRLDEYLRWHSKRFKKEASAMRLALFGLIGGWIDDGYFDGRIRYSKHPNLVVDSTGNWAVTKHFVLRCMGRK
jgi:hypothetical protein